MNRSRPATTSAVAQEEYFLQQAKKMGGVSGLGLENFSDTDRFATIINFLDNPEIFEKVGGFLYAVRLSIIPPIQY